MIPLFATQQILLNLDQLETNILEFLCEQSSKLRNCATYLLRQSFFTFKKVLVGKFDLNTDLKENPHYQIFYSQTAQQICTEVTESFLSYKELLPLWYSGQLKDEPKLPKYRKKGGLSGFTYTKQSLAFDIESGLIRLPLGNTFKAWFGIEDLKMQMPVNLRFEDIKELRILPRNGCFYAEFVRETAPMKTNLSRFSKRVLGIDPGINNWLTCLSNARTSFIIDGRHVKSLNQNYNKRVAKLKARKPQGFWSEELAAITEKRNRQMRDAVNKAAVLVIERCLRRRLGTIVFGWNKEQRQEATLGKNTQDFVQIPTQRLKARIKQLCEFYDIEFVEVEESYTSKCSFLDEDFLPTFGEENKPKGWKPSGKRVHRGLYKSADGTLVNADLNGAGNVIRKVEAQLGLVNLVKSCKGVLTHPPRLRVWDTKKKRNGAALAHCAVSF